MRAILRRLKRWWYCDLKHQHAWGEPAILLGAEVVRCDLCGTTGWHFPPK